MAATYEQILKDIQQKKFQPIYFLHGEEPYFIDQLTDLLVENVLTEAERSFNQLILYGKDTDAESIRNACLRYPMMSNYQLVVVKEAQNLKNLQALEAYVEKPVPSTVLVVSHKYKSIDKRLKIAKLLEKNAVLFESKKLKEDKLPDWIQQQFQLQYVAISPRAAHMLAEYLGNNLERLSNAVNKLVIRKSEGGSVTEKDIEENIGISKEYNVFELVNALAAKDLNKITKITAYLRTATKENPFPVVISVLYGFFSKLTAMYISGKTDKDSLKAIGVLPWVEREYLQAVRNYGPKLKDIMKLIEQYDLRFKGVGDTGTDEDKLLTEMILKIAHV